MKYFQRAFRNGEKKRCHIQTTNLTAKKANNIGGSKQQHKFDTRQLVALVVFSKDALVTYLCKRQLTDI